MKNLQAVNQYIANLAIWNIKLHNFHFNVVGSQFVPAHKYLEEVYDVAFDYYDAVVNDDISRVDRVKRDSERTKRILKSYARNIATQASLETIRSDIISNDVETFDKEALYGYLNALKRIFVIEN